MKILILCLACVTTVAAYSQKGIPEDWKLSGKQAKQMMEYLNNCRGDCYTSTATPDTAKESYIRSYFPNAASVTWVSARYRAEDVDRYSRRNWQTARSGGGAVGGYTTQILKVVDGDGSTYYFDIASICPPPQLCDTLVEEERMQ